MARFRCQCLVVKIDEPTDGLFDNHLPERGVCAKAMVRVHV